MRHDTSNVDKQVAQTTADRREMRVALHELLSWCIIAAAIVAAFCAADAADPVACAVIPVVGVLGFVWVQARKSCL